MKTKFIFSPCTAYNLVCVMRGALPDYFGKVIVKFSAQNSAGMCCGQESSRGFRCQSFPICCSNPETGLPRFFYYSLEVFHILDVGYQSSLQTCRLRANAPSSEGHSVCSVFTVAWVRRRSLFLLKLCSREGGEGEK